MKVRQLHYLLSQALANTPDIAEMDISVDSELDTTMELGIILNRNQVLILGEDSYRNTKGMTIYQYYDK